MIAFPNAKINIGLQVLSKRRDGYHNISSILYPIGLSDVLEVLPNSAQKCKLNIHGLKIPSDGKPNLCERSFEILNAEYPISGVDAHLLKNIPTGAGLGGGSSDASFMLKSLNELFQLSLTENQLETFASELGSDCPFFIRNKAAIVSGTGTTLESIDLDLSSYFLILILPNIQVSTSQAYSGVSPDNTRVDLAELIQRPIEEWKGLIGNDFEDSVFKIFPELEIIKTELNNCGALYTSMSGSGSSIYGIFKEETELPKTLEHLPHWKGFL